MRKPNQKNVTLSDADMLQLAYLTEHYQKSASELFAAWINREYCEVLAKQEQEKPNNGEEIQDDRGSTAH